jgi:hypothetical protein
MPHNVAHAPHGIAREIGLQKNRGKGKVDIPAGLVNGDALDVPFGMVAAVNATGEGGRSICKI